MRLLYFGDKHERVTTPENRMDNYTETMKLKTKEIVALGKKYGISAYLQPGDFFDTPNPPLDFVAEVMNMWSGVDIFDTLTKLVSGEIQPDEAMQTFKSYIPIVGVPGNHELFGNNLKTLPKTAIGMVNKLGLMRFATKENPYYFYTEDGAKVAVTGTPYHLDIDAPEHVDDYVVEEKLGDFHIHIVHGYLTDKGLGNMFRHTVIDQIKHTKADLTITGHDHIGFPLTEIDGKWFVNPGAIPRTKNDIKEMKRKPKVLLIDITKAEGMKLKEIYLKSAQEGELVLNRRKIVERKKREERIEDFKKAVRDAGVSKSTDITEIIRDLASSKALPLVVRDDVIDRVSMKKKEMAEILEGVVKEAYVEKIVLENFQSHEYTELELSRGLNIFVGESRQGKTAVLRAFQWVYENKPTGKRVIKIGADCAKVTVFLSNGFIITRIMETKRSGKNGYEITDPTTGEVAYHNTKILPEVQKLLGYNPFVIDNDLQFNLNFMKQGTGWFLIGDHFSAPVKAKIIGGIYGTQYADAVAREYDAEDRKVNDDLKKAQAEVQNLDEQISQYSHLADLEVTLIEVEALLKEIDALTERKEKIVNLTTKRKQLETVVQENEEIIRSLEGIEHASLLLEQVKLHQMKRNQLGTLIAKRNETQKKYDLLEEALVALKHVDEANELFVGVGELYKQSGKIRQVLDKRKRTIEQIVAENKVIEQTEQIEEATKLYREIEKSQTRRKELKEKAERAKRLEGTRKEVSTKLSYIEETLEKTKDIEEARKLLESFKSNIERKVKIEKILTARKRVVQSVASEDAMIKKQNNETAVLANKYKSLLEEAGSCPVCHSTIDKVIVERIVEQYAAS